MKALPIQTLDDYLNLYGIEVGDLFPKEDISEDPSDAYRAATVSAIPKDLIPLYTKWEKRFRDARKRGQMSLQFIDEFCVKLLRKHPSEIYGSAWFEVA